MSTIDPRDAGQGGPDDRDEINARFEQLVAPLRGDVPDAPGTRRPGAGRAPGTVASPAPGQAPRPASPRHESPRDQSASNRSASNESARSQEPSRPTEPFSLDAAMAAAEPDDEPLELPVLPRPRMRPGLVAGFGLLAAAFVLAFLAMLGVRVGHDLGVIGTGLGVIGLVVLLLNVRRGERDDSLDHDPRDGSRV